MARPQISLAHAQQIARDTFGLATSGDDVRELPSSADRNFRVGEIVLKFVRAERDDSWVECENALLDHLGAAHRDGLSDSPLPLTPKLHRTAGGEPTAWVEDAAGKSCGVRALRFLAGEPLRTRPHSARLLHNVGAALGAVDQCLSAFEHPAAERASAWDLLRASEGINADIDAVEDLDRARLVERLAQRFALETEPLLDRLPQSVIHGDANDDNLLIEAQPGRAGYPCSAGESIRPSRVAGLIDFGDALLTATVCEPAIALAYLLLDGSSPAGRRLPRGPVTRILDPFLRGYSAQRPVDELECAVLFPLALQRLCFSVVHAARAERDEPTNEYLQISAEAAWRTLARLEQVSPRRLEWTVRHACGHEPVAGTRRLSTWLAGRRKKPVLGKKLTRSNVRLLDLSLTNPMFAEAGDPADESAVTAWASAVLDLDLTKPAARTRGGARRKPQRIGWGRWDEPRLVYAGAQFAGDSTVHEVDRGLLQADDQRTVHLGVDLFAPPGTSVFAPIDGIVWSVADNADAFDYGGTVILEHVVALEGLDETATEVPTARFFTLYGHLDPESTGDLEIGQEIVAGDRLGDLGDPSCNGGWTPHLHLQLITDLLDRDDHRPTNFAGVAPAGERELWKQICPDPAALLFDPPPRSRSGLSGRNRVQRRPEFPPAVVDLEGTRTRREGYLAPNLSVAYESPLLIVRGRRAGLYDHLGRRYVDLVNNVCHVGHTHPRVVAALREQATLLNTNTRYLHPNIGEYAERLLMTLPEKFDVCWFVNSGSEANDLALRLARNATGRDQILCLEGAYHGHTGALIEVSPYKHDGAGGQGTPQRIHKVVAPDPYRGRYRGDDTAQRYAADVVAAVEASQAHGGPAAMIVESIQSCGGQILYPDGYLKRAFEAVRGAGGLCIADEVQVGMGRVGSHFWAFELGDVVPDIVTAGKPIGNGHPLAAVFTTREIAEAFDNGMEYFNTFGGNPVSCAVGQAVLDVLERENLQRHAWQLGRHFLDRLRDLQSRHPQIGDVRGTGLFLGFELVSDPEERTPDAALAAYVVERMRERGFLLSTDGPDRNVIKIKPPLVIQQPDVDATIEHLAEVFEEVAR